MLRVLTCLSALVVLGQLGIAPAAAFDDWAYSTCTATSGIAPGANFDGVSSQCCVDHGGVPTPTSYGMGCAAPVADPAPDYRPVIYMPTLPASDGDLSADELLKQPPLPGMPPAP